MEHALSHRASQLSSCATFISTTNHFTSISQNTQQLQQMDILLFIVSTRSAFLMKKFLLDKISLINAPMLHIRIGCKYRGPKKIKRSRFTLVYITKILNPDMDVIARYINSTKQINKTHSKQFVI